jgi:hypothetical protein
MIFRNALFSLSVSLLRRVRFGTLSAKPLAVAVRWAWRL